jgi:hypothetical protein
MAGFLGVDLAVSHPEKGWGAGTESDATSCQSLLVGRSKYYKIQSPKEFANSSSFGAMLIYLLKWVCLAVEL